MLNILKRWIIKKARAFGMIDDFPGSIKPGTLVAATEFGMAVVKADAPYIDGVIDSYGKLMVYPGDNLQKTAYFCKKLAEVFGDQKTV